MVEGNLEINRTLRKGLGTCKLCDKQPLWCTCLYPQFTGEDDVREPGPIILASTDGNDYSVLDKVDPNVKGHAVNGNLDSVEQIKDATEDTLSAAEGKATSILTPENKHWILREMGFKGLGGGRWKHILFDEIIEFNLDGSTLIQLAFAIHKTGYKNAHTEWASQQKTGTA